MKSLFAAIFFSICLWWSFQANAKTLISENKVWIQVVHKLPSFTIVTEYLKIKGDTVINQLTYKKVFQSFDKNQEIWTKFGYIRETWDQKVYYRADTSKRDYLFYDFSVKLNDIVKLATIESYYNSYKFRNLEFSVCNIDSILIDTKYRKRIQLQHGKNSKEYFIEGIGSLSGLLYWDGGLVGGDGYDLICFLEDNILMLHDEKYPTCYYKWPSTSIDNINEDNKLVEINPLDNGALQIHTLKNSLGKLKFFSINGELILTQDIKSPETQIYLPQSGTLIYLFISEKNEAQTGKIVLK